jgi:amino acid adenylation domain-containing protein
VREAHVITWESSQEDVRLIAYIVLQSDRNLHGYQELLKEQTSEWQYTFDETYSSNKAQTSIDFDVDFNIAGWNNSYDGKPIPTEEMRQWLDNTLGHIKALTPQRVLEIGCGTGMILFNIAPQVESYWATDLSETAIKRLQSVSGAELLHQEAIDFTNIPQSYFDTVIINSVAQYFPDLEYFRQVIAGALDSLAPGGSLFLGDNRNLVLLDAFHASVALFQSDDKTDKETFSALMEQIADKENELVINPSFFVNLTEIFDSLETVEVHLKAETSNNELTKYRYDVILHKKGGEEREYIEPMWKNWQSGMELEDLRQSLSPNLEIPIGYCGILNGRLIQDEAILQWLQDDNTLSKVGEISPVNIKSAINPSELYALADETGCQAIISYSPELGANYFDVCFYPSHGKAKQRPIMPIVKQKTDSNATQSDSINPIKTRFSKTLIHQIKQQVREHLPEYMCPSAFILLDKLPITPSGKLDRGALPPPTQEAVIAKEAFVQASTPIQKRLCDIWSNVLGIETIGLTNDFFSLGGHSLLATKLVSRIREEFKIVFPLRTVFEYPTIAGQAEQIDSLNADEENIIINSDTIQRVTYRENLPLSFAQQRLWFLDKLESHNPAYNIVVGFRMDGDLNQEALHQSLQDIVNRHEILRTNFSQDNYGNPIQIVHQSNQVQLFATDLSHISESKREKQLQEIVTRQALEPFNLETDSLLRLYLYKLEEHTHAFVAVMHHIISDAWSFGIMVKELTQSYTTFCQGKTPSLPPLSLQYADFAYWQRTTFAQTQLQQQLEYWKQELSGDIQPLELPTDYPRPAIASYQGKEISFVVESQHYQAFKKLCESHSTTLFMGLLAVFKTLLMRYSGQCDILVGTPIANRNHRQTEDLIGFFVNTLVIRSDLSHNPSFTDLLAQIKEKTLQAYTHQDIPFEKLVEELQPERNLGYNPLFQVMFVLQNTPIGNLELPSLSLTPLEMESTTVKFDLSLSMSETEKGLEGIWEYNTDLFDSGTITRMIEHFQTLLAGIVSNAGSNLQELPLLTKTEQDKLLREWNNTYTGDLQNSSVHQWFETQVEKTPDAVAIVWEEKQFTYRELNTKANQLAHYLQSLGVKPEMLVGIYVERSLDMVVGLLGILKAGGAYLPLDPSYPQERNSFILGDSQVSVLLTQQKLIAQLPMHPRYLVCLDANWETISRHSRENPNCQVEPENLAYMIYTSGSTGKPKGVLIQHQALVNYTEARMIECELSNGDKALQFASIGFDGAVAEIFSTLVSGATLVLRTDEMLSSISTFVQKCRDYKLTVVELPTAYWHQLTFELGKGNLELPPSLKVIVIAGEKAIPEQVSLWKKTVGAYPRLINDYGPTEATVSATSCNLSELNLTALHGREVPIGKPLQNYQAYLLDKSLQPVPIGVIGELYLGGVGLARGYSNKANLTADKFIPNPFSEKLGSRIYKTGDLGRYFNDGKIEYFGRVDDQVKLRGFRIELGEVETALKQHSQVRETLVTIREDEPGNKQLVAYIIPHENTPNSIILRQFLKEKLPIYMVPGVFVILDSLPLTPNGKVDRKALPAPILDNCLHSRNAIPPRTALEYQLVQIWEAVLKIKPISVTDNFFELGGHSLLAICLITEIEKQLGYTIPVASFFQEITIEKIALYLENNRESTNSDILLPLQVKRNQRPLFLVHPAGGYGLGYSLLANKLGINQSVYALQARGLDGKEQPLNTFQAMASSYIKAIREIQPSGSYLIGGYSSGGLIAFEIASQLEAAGECIENLLIIDTEPPSPHNKAETRLDDDIALLIFIVEQIGLHFNAKIKLKYEDFSVLDEVQRLDYALQVLQNYQLVTPNSGKNFVTGLINVYKANSQASMSYQPKAINADISLFKTEALAKQFPNKPALGWDELTSQAVYTRTVQGNHDSILQEPSVSELSIAIQELLQKSV